MAVDADDADVGPHSAIRPGLVPQAQPEILGVVRQWVEVEGCRDHGEVGVLREPRQDVAGRRDVDVVGVVQPLHDAGPVLGATVAEAGGTSPDRSSRTWSWSIDPPGAVAAASAWMRSNPQTAIRAFAAQLSLSAPTRTARSMTGSRSTRIACQMPESCTAGLSRRSISRSAAGRPRPAGRPVPSGRTLWRRLRCAEGRRGSARAMRLRRVPTYRDGPSAPCARVGASKSSSAFRSTGVTLRIGAGPRPGAGLSPRARGDPACTTRLRNCCVRVSRGFSKMSFGCRAPGSSRCRGSTPGWRPPWRIPSRGWRGAW